MNKRTPSQVESEIRYTTRLLQRAAALNFEDDVQHWSRKRERLVAELNAARAAQNQTIEGE